MISKIELREIAQGYRTVDGVEEIVPFPDHKMLMGNYGPGGSMRQLGYVFFRPKPTINCVCVRCDPEDMRQIQALVEQETGLSFDSISQAPSPAVVQAGSEDDEDEDEDDDEE